MRSTFLKALKTLGFTIIAISVVAISHADDQLRASTDYAEVAAAINKTMRAYHYDPAELDSAHYRQVESAVAALATVAMSDDEFMDGFREIWRNGPFSHVELNPAQMSADDLAGYLDTLRLGGGGAVLEWQDDVAILTVNTMMGLDTIEDIDAAYVEIAGKETRALIIDLRENGGGAFAIRPLISHLLTEPVDAGGFISQRWNAMNRGAPGPDDMVAVDPWEGWSIRAFWADVQEESLLRIRLAPVEPVYLGPVYVLTSGRTASAAELATDVLKSSGRAVIIGENTAGEMLSQKIYDVPGGFHLSLPIADYYSAVYGRIEGVGVSPNIETDAEDALEVALRQ